MKSRTHRYISKSSVMAGCQCPKLLWMRLNDRSKFPPVDARQQAMFDQGHEVGDLAKTLFPGGIEVGGDPWNSKDIAERTEELLAKRVPLFEAGFCFNGGYALVDILNPVGRDGWEIIEVKSSTSVKPEHISDVAFQKYLCEGVGLKIRGCGLMHINREYVRSGAIATEQLLVIEQVTEEVDLATGDLLAQFSEQKELVKRETCPEVAIGSHCSSPYDCPLKEMCWSHLPKHPVTDIYYAKKKAFALLEDGIRCITAIGTGTSLNSKQEIQVEAVRSGVPHVDESALSKFLSQMEYPVSYLDFETYRSAIPPLDGTWPYQQIPFQYSLHIVDRPGAEPRHLEYLAADTTDRRSEFLERLSLDLPQEGSIVVYHASFELSRLREGRERFPEHREWLVDVEERIVDLLIPFRNFEYYHPDQHGSASLKSVLPALTGSGYESLAIQDGDSASIQFLESCREGFDPRDRQRIRADLKAYCGLDTYGMIEIVEALSKLCREGSIESRQQEVISESQAMPGYSA